MSIMELGALGEFLASLGVIISLVFVGYQLRQSRAEMKASTMQARTDSFVNLFATRMTVPALADALIKQRESPDDLTPRDLHYIHSDLNARTLALENWFYQRSVGNLDEAMTTRLDGLLIYRRPIARDWWDRVARRSGGFSPDFIAHVDRVLATRDAEGWPDFNDSTI
jgi:hypothetical protein